MERQIPASQARPGDLVFFAGADGTPTAPGHVGIVVNPATHTMIDAYATGDDVEAKSKGLKGRVAKAFEAARSVGAGAKSGRW